MSKIEAFVTYVNDKKLASIKENVDISKHTTYKTGGTYSVFVEPGSIMKFQQIVNYLVDNDISYFVIGNGSNIIMPDGVNEQVIVKLTHLCNYYVTDKYLYAEAGILVPKLALELAYQGVSLFEFASGIPGTLGGCIYMNAGAYGKEMSDYIIDAIVYDCDKKMLHEVKREEMDLGYRHSIFHNKNWIVVAARFSYESENKDEIIKLINERRRRRVETQPIGEASAGSVFRNFDDMPVWKLVDECGLRGECVGDACISDKHSNMIINRGNATSKDILDLIELIKTRVKEQTGRDLIVEQKIIEWID